jgi:predicted transcriptional regulator
MTSNRNDAELYRLMLKAILVYQPAFFKNIMNFVELPYNQCKSRLQFLAEIGCIETSQDYLPFGNKRMSMSFTITDKGRKLVEKLDSLNSIVELDRIRVNIPGKKARHAAAAKAIL